MTYIYYTANEGRRNAYGHTTTRGEVYKIATDAEGVPCLATIGEYVHQSGGASIAASILTVCESAGIDTNGGYYGKYRDAVTLVQI